MNDIQDTVDVRRVPFTYYSLLYKLDNIHLKQTYRRKRFVSKPLKRTELKRLQKEKTGHQLNTHKEVENGFQSIKENEDQLNEKRLRKIQSPSLKADNSHTVLSWDDKSNSIQCDLDSDVASDLSIDGEQRPERKQKEVTFDEGSSSISNIDVEEDSSSFRELLPSHAERNERQISGPLGYLSGKRFYPHSEAAFQTKYDVNNTYQHTTSDEISAKEHRLNQTTTFESLYVREQNQHSTNQYTNTTKQCSTKQTSGELVNIPYNEVIVDVSGGKLDNSKQSNTTKVKLSSLQESFENAPISSEDSTQAFGNGNIKKVQKSDESGLGKIPTLDLIDNDLDNHSIEQTADLNTINGETTGAEQDEMNRCNNDLLEGLVKTKSDLSLPCTIEIKKRDKTQKARELTSEKIIVTKHISVIQSATSLQTSHSKSDLVLTKTNKITCDDEELSRTLPTNNRLLKSKINLSTKVFDKMYGSCNRQNGLFVKEYDNNTRLFSDLFNDRSSPRRLSISSEKAPSENKNSTFVLSDQSKAIKDNDLRMMCFSKPETSLEDGNIPKSRDQSGYSTNEVSKLENNSLKLSTVFSKSYDGGTQLTYKRDTVFSASFPIQTISAKSLQTDLSISIDQQHISSVTKKETLDFHTEQLKKEVANTYIKDQTTNLIQVSMDKKGEDFLEHSTNTSQNYEVSSQVTGFNITEESSTESCDRPECINDRTTWDKPAPEQLDTNNASFVKTDTRFVEENGKVGDNSNELSDNEKCENKIGENITGDSNFENSGQDVESEQSRSIYPKPESSESKAGSYDPSLETAEFDRRIENKNEIEKSCRTSEQTVDNKTTEEQTHSDSTDCKEESQNTIKRLNRPENAIHGFLSMQARDIHTEFDCPVNSSKSETISGDNCPSREIIKIDGHYSDKNETRVLAGNQSKQAIDKGATKERTHPSSADGTDIIQITIKRLDRPKKSESKSKKSSAKNMLRPFTAQQNCPFPDESSAFGKMPGGKYSKSSESFTSKMFVENMANLPILTGQDIQMSCPTCGEAVFYTGKTETKCVDEIHQMLLKIPSLQTTAEKYGLVVRNIAGDGNCMFSAVIDQLRIAGDFTFTKDSLRSSAVEYLREHPCQEDGSHLMCFLSTESWEEYLSRMNRDGEWGDHMILNAITEVIGRNITVLGSSGNVTQLFPHNITVTDDLFLDSVYLGHIGGTHYVSLRPKDWEKTWPMNAKIRRMTKFLKLPEETSNCWNDQSDASDIALEKESSIKTIEDCSHVDKTSVLDSLSTDIHYVDPISRVPVMHLSYILKELLHPEYFCRPQTTTFSPTGETSFEFEQIGTNAELLNVSLINFSKSRKERYHADYACIKQMVSPQSSWYTVVMNEVSVGHGKGQMMLLVDSEQTHAGFLRLRPIACSCCSDFRTIARKMDGRWFVNDLQISLWVKKGDKDNFKYIKAVKCPTWPYQAVEYLTRSRPVQWPKQETIDLICKSGCYLAHKSHPDSNEKDIEFQFMFCSAEKQLIRDEMTPDMKYCYYVFKALVEFQTKDVNCKLTNYILKTTWFYACEAIPSETWRNSCGSCLLYMLDLLHTWLRNSNIPNYFISHYNMIDHWRKKDVDQVCDKIETLRLFPCMVLHFISEEYGLTHSWLIDSVMASSKKYKADGDVNWVVENTFNPTTFYLTGYSLKTSRNNEIVFGQLSEAYEKNLIWTGQSF